jgi:putative FmdB family regulatory protein
LAAADYGLAPRFWDKLLRSVGGREVFAPDGVCWSRAMPTYNYRCEKCGKTFERTETISEHETAKPQCPKCGSMKVSTVPARVYVVTSKKS